MDLADIMLSEVRQGNISLIYKNKTKTKTNYRTEKIGGCQILGL